MNPWWKIGLVLAYTAIIAYAAQHARWVIDDDTARALAEQQQQAVIAAQSGVIAKEESSAKINNEVSNGLQTRLSDIDHLYAGGLFPTSSPAGSNMPSIPYASGGCHGTTGAAGLSARAQERLAALMKQADIQTARLKACQEWVREQAK